MQFNIYGISILFYLLLADYITGVCVAFVEKKVKSSIGRKGIFEKFGIVMCVFVCTLIDSLGIISVQMQPLVVLFFIANESLSIFENLGRLNVPLPKFLTESLRELKARAEKRE